MSAQRYRARKERPKNHRSPPLCTPINPSDVTAVVLARNEARNLPRLFDALPPGIRVMVVDHRSHDATARIARARGASVIQREFDGFVNARTFALSRVETPWTLMIDADEAPDDRLARAIVDAGERFDGYCLLRTTFFCGKPMRLWSGERLLRLFRTDRAVLKAAPAAGGDAQIHEQWQCSGPTADLPGTLLHYSYPDIAAYRRKFAEYTETEAAGLPYASAFGVLVCVIMGTLRFLRLLFLRGALRDGWRGVYVAFFSALYPVAVQWKALVRAKR